MSRNDPVIQRRIERGNKFREVQYSEENAAINGLPELTIFKNVRSDIGYSIECDWTGEDVITFRHVPGLTLDEETGRIKAGNYGRSDVLGILWQGYGSAWVNPSKYTDAGYTIQVSAHERSLSDAEHAYLKASIELLVELNREYVERELRFFMEEPWMQLDGMTPDEAINCLERSGWYRRVLPTCCEECGEEEHTTDDCPHLAIDPDYPDGVYIQEGYEGE